MRRRNWSSLNAKTLSSYQAIVCLKLCRISRETGWVKLWFTRQTLAYLQTLLLKSTAKWNICVLNKTWDDFTNKNLNYLIFNTQIKKYSFDTSYEIFQRLSQKLISLHNIHLNTFINTRSTIKHLNRIRMNKISFYFKLYTIKYLNLYKSDYEITN